MLQGNEEDRLLGIFFFFQNIHSKVGQLFGTLGCVDLKKAVQGYSSQVLWPDARPSWRFAEGPGTESCSKHVATVIAWK